MRRPTVLLLAVAAAAALTTLWLVRELRVAAATADAPPAARPR
jgi:hypothetical protein